MLKHTKNAAAYLNREEASKQYNKCIKKCADYLDNVKLHDSCIAKCRESDWNFQQDSKFSEQLTSIIDKLNDGVSDLSDMSIDLGLMGI